MVTRLSLQTRSLEQLIAEETGSHSKKTMYTELIHANLAVLLITSIVIRGSL